MREVEALGRSRVARCGIEVLVGVFRANAHHSHLRARNGLHYGVIQRIGVLRGVGRRGAAGHGVVPHVGIRLARLGHTLEALGVGEVKHVLSEQALQRVALGYGLAAHQRGRQSADAPVVVAAQFVVDRHVVARRVEREGVVELILAVVGYGHGLAAGVVAVNIINYYRVVAEGHLRRVGNHHAHVGGERLHALDVKLELVAHRHGRSHIEVEQPHLHGFVAHDDGFALSWPVGCPGVAAALVGRQRTRVGVVVAAAAAVNHELGVVGVVVVRLKHAGRYVGYRECLVTVVANGKVNLRRLHILRVVHLLHRYRLGNNGKSLARGGQHDGYLHLLAVRVVGGQREKVLVGVGQLVGLHCHAEVNAAARSYHVVELRLHLDGHAGVDVHARHDKAPLGVLVLRSGESVDAVEHAVLVELIHELIRSVGIEHTLEVEARHHRVAIVLERHHGVVVKLLVVYAVHRACVHRVVAPQRSYDVAVEGLAVGQCHGRLGEHLVVFLGLGELHEATVVEIHLGVLLAIEGELKRKVNLLVVCLVVVVRQVAVLVVVVEYVYPVVLHVLIVLAGLVDIPYGRLVVVNCIRQAIPEVGLGACRHGFVAIVGNGERGGHVGAIRSGERSLGGRHCGHRHTDNLGRHGHFGGRGVGIGHGDHVAHRAARSRGQCHAHVLALVGLHGEAGLQVVGNGHRAVLQRYRRYLNGLRSVVEHAHGAVLAGCAEHLAEVNLGGVDHGVGHKLVAGDVGRDVEHLARRLGVVGVHDDVVGKLAGEEVLVGLCRECHLLGLANAHISVGTRHSRHHELAWGHNLHHAARGELRVEGVARAGDVGVGHAHRVGTLNVAYAYIIEYAAVAHGRRVVVVIIYGGVALRVEHHVHAHCGVGAVDALHLHVLVDHIELAVLVAVAHL